MHITVVLRAIGMLGTNQQKSVSNSIIKFGLVGTIGNSAYIGIAEKERGYILLFRFINLYYSILSPYDEQNTTKEEINVVAD